MSYLPSQFVTCPRCQGGGFEPEKTASVCSNCYGLATGTFWNGEFLYWGASLATGPVAIRRAQAWLRRVFIVALWILAAAGAGAWLYWVIAHAAGATGIRAGILFSFWGERHALLLLFWVGVLAGAYAWYQTQRQRMARPIIPSSCSLAPAPTTPNNWKELRRYARRRDVSRHYHETALRVIEDAALAARNHNEPALTVPRLAAVLLRHAATKQASYALWKRLGLASKDAVQKLELAAQQAAATAQKPLSVEARQLLIEAYVVASDANRRQVGALSVWQPLAYFASSLQSFLQQRHIAPAAWFRAAEWQTQVERAHSRRQQRGSTRALRQWHRARQAAAAAIATPLVERFCDDLTSNIQRTTTYYVTAAVQAAEYPLQAQRAPVIYIAGAAGSGKSSLLHALAERWAHEPCLPHAYRHLALVDVQKLSSQTRVPPADALLSIVEEAGQTKTTAVAVDDIPADWIPNLPANGELAAPLLVTGENLPRTDVTLDTLSDDDRYGIVITHAVQLENANAVEIPYAALDVVLHAAKQTAHESLWPSRAIDILEYSVKRAQELQQTVVTPETVAKIAATGTNITYTQLLRATENVS